MGLSFFLYASAMFSVDLSRPAKTLPFFSRSCNNQARKPMEEPYARMHAHALTSTRANISLELQVQFSVPCKFDVNVLKQVRVRVSKEIGT